VVDKVSKNNDADYQVTVHTIEKQFYAVLSCLSIYTADSERSNLILQQWYCDGLRGRSWAVTLVF